MSERECHRIYVDGGGGGYANAMKEDRVRIVIREIIFAK